MQSGRDLIVAFAQCACSDAATDRAIRVCAVAAFFPIPALIVHR